MKTRGGNTRLILAVLAFLFAIFLSEFFGATRHIGSKFHSNETKTQQIEADLEQSGNDTINQTNNNVGKIKKIRISEDAPPDENDENSTSLRGRRPSKNQIANFPQVASSSIFSESTSVTPTNSSQIPPANIQAKPQSTLAKKQTIIRDPINAAVERLKQVPFAPPPQSDEIILNPVVFQEAQHCLLNSSYVPSGNVSLLHDPNYVLPEDLEDHYIELLNITAPLRNVSMSWYAGYHGPWLENAFINEFCCDKPLSYFGGLVPLFVQWTDLWHLYKGEGWQLHPVGKQLFSKLRKDVIYLVVSQHADGIFHKSRYVRPRNHWNLLIFSGGGHGHAPIPLFLEEQQYEEFDKSFPQYLFVFAGTLNPRIFQVRKAMVDILDELSVGDPPIRVRFYSGKLWQKVMRSGLLNLAPRGYGRTSFRIVEAVQMGLIPVYLYDDHDWSPYKGTAAHVSNFGYVVHISNFKTFAQRIGLAQHEDPYGFLAMLEEKREKLRQVRDSHYTMAGLMEQIGYFVQGDPRSSITCQRNPQQA